MTRGPLFRLLRLDRHLCRSCHRDVVYRVDTLPDLCRWCGTPTIDFGELTQAAQRITVALGATGAAFAQAADALIQTLRAFRTPVIAFTYVVDVETATHEDLKTGDTASRYSRVQVLARDETEARLIACQMVARDDRMPTRATIRSPQELRAEEEARQITQAYLRNPLNHAVQVRREEIP